jgi:aldehyde:ferredoxin oxidoreductase
MGAIETQKALIDELGTDTRVLAIGQAGERLSRHIFTYCVSLKNPLPLRYTCSLIIFMIMKIGENSLSVGSGISLGGILLKTQGP